LSNSATAVLQRYDIRKTYDDDPEKAIRFLTETAVHDDRRDILYALAEISYLYGIKLQGSSSVNDQVRAPDSFLLSAVYAYLYLLGDGKQPPPTAYDFRFREACDLYNRALWLAFPQNENGEMDLRSSTRTLPVGTLDITLNTDKFYWNIDAFEKFLPADAFRVHGFTVRNRTPGMGLPLIAVTRKSPESPDAGALPVTAFLRVAGGIRDLAGGAERATLELYCAYDDAEVSVNGRTVPLEADTTTPMAYRLNDSAVWGLGFKRFRTAAKIDKSLILTQPYERGRIPVVLVHGTASSPVWWAEMLNTLRADPVIRKNFQFWGFQYNSSRMMMLSAADLRDALTSKVKQLDPQGKDPALRKMVVIGHSQGGLLTKLTAVAPGDRLWKAVSDKSMDDIKMDDNIRKMARRAFFFEPLPFVKRVVFIATPHRGSFLTKNWVRSLVRNIVSIPLDIITLNPEKVVRFTNQLKLPSVFRKVPTSIDGMSSENPILHALAKIPLAPGVTGHSIIAVLPGMEIKTGNDGVVEYQSAHLDGMASEFIVRSGHSCQGHPLVIEEVRRILMEHLGVEVEGPKAPEPAPVGTPRPAGTEVR
jgi:pimeloyl-ACP methyl ester carboxylesterase